MPKKRICVQTILAGGGEAEIFFLASGFSVSKGGSISIFDEGPAGSETVMAFSPGGWRGAWVAAEDGAPLFLESKASGRVASDKSERSGHVADDPFAQAPAPTDEKPNANTIVGHAVKEQDKEAHDRRREARIVAIIEGLSKVPYAGLPEFSKAINEEPSDVELALSGALASKRVSPDAVADDGMQAKLSGCLPEILKNNSFSKLSGLMEILRERADTAGVDQIQLRVWLLKNPRSLTER